MKEMLPSQGMCAEQNCRDQKSSVCYFTLLPFGHHLKDIFTYVRAGIIIYYIAIPYMHSIATIIMYYY